MLSLDSSKKYNFPNIYVQNFNTIFLTQTPQLILKLTKNLPN